MSVRKGLCIEMDDLALVLLFSWLITVASKNDNTLDLTIKSLSCPSHTYGYRIISPKAQQSGTYLDRF